MTGVYVIIPVCNELHYTKQCLESLRHAGVPESCTVIIDNASSDGTGAFLAERKGLRVITNATNRGCSAAWNQGVEVANAPWSFILNNDTVVARGCIEGLLSFAQESGCRILSPGKAEGEIDYGFPEFAAAFQSRMSRVVRRGLASGCAFMVHRSVFEKIGFFDVKVGLAGNEDDDFFRRARLAGFDLATTGRAYLHHFGSVTRKSINRERGRRSNAPLTDKQYYRRKHRLTWARRKAERLQEKLTFGFWRWNEKRRFGLTLKMARLDGQWYYS